MKFKHILALLVGLCLTINLNAQNPTQEVLKGILGSKNKKAENLPDTYSFGWEFKTKMEMVSKKKSENGVYDMNYFINKNKDYYAIEFENEEIKQSGGKSILVLDFKSEAMVVLSEYGERKIAMLTKLKDPKKKKIKDKDRNYTFKEVGAKTILGYECYGMEVEYKNSLVTLWFTLDAPVNFSAYFAFSSEAAPKGFSDPQLFDILKEEALLMEMEMINTKKNQKMIMTAVSLEETKTEFHKKDYDFMKLGF